MDTTEAVTRFLTAKRAKGLQDTTIGWYEWILGKFADAHPELPTTPEPIEAFIASIRGAPETRHGYFRAIRTLYNWLVRRRSISESPIPYMEPPRVPKKVPRWLEITEAQRLFHAAHTPLEIALIRLLLDTGIRIGEARNLDREHIHDTFIRVVGKSGEHIVPISKRTADALRSLPVSIKAPSVVFAGSKGRYHVRTLQRRVNDCFVRAGMAGRRSSPHTLRHTFGTLWDGDEGVLQDILGHSDISTTRRYRHFRISRSVAQHRVFSPMASIEATQLAFPLT